MISHAIVTGQVLLDNIVRNLGIQNVVSFKCLMLTGHAALTQACMTASWRASELTYLARKFTDARSPEFLYNPAQLGRVEI